MSPRHSSSGGGLVSLGGHRSGAYSSPGGDRRSCFSASDEVSNEPGPELLSAAAVSGILLTSALCTLGLLHAVWGFGTLDTACGERPPLVWTQRYRSLCRCIFVAGSSGVLPGPCVFPTRNARTRLRDDLV